MCETFMGAYDIYKSTNLNPILRASLNPRPTTKVTFRFYVHFNRQDVVHNEGVVFMGSKYAPYKTNLCSMVELEGNSFCASKSFYITDRELRNTKMTVMEYIKNITVNSQSYKEFISSTTNDMLNERLDEIKRKHNVLLDKDSIDYSTQICYCLQEVIY